VIEELAGFKVAAECTNGIEAVAAIEAGAADVGLLDIRMPGLDGFEVVRRVGVEDMPPLVFVTAFDEYAVRAFEVCALDYVEKPWQRERLVTALQRAAEDHARRIDTQFEGRLTALLEHQAEPDGGAQRLVLRAGARLVVIAVDEVEWIESAANYVRLHAGGSEYLARETLSSLDERLPHERFVRIHRSTIVALACVRELVPDGEGELAVVLRDGTRLRCSRSYRAALEERLS
jgi:two-component system LytT family response regulator